MVLLRARHAEITASSGRSVLILGQDGQALSPRHGFFFEEARFLSAFELLVDGRRPECFAIANAGRDRVLAYHGVRSRGRAIAPAVFLEADYRVAEWLDIDLRLESYAPSGTEPVDLELRVAADFADLNEVEKGVRRQSADVTTRWDPESRTMRFDYRHPALPLGSSLRVVEAPAAPVYRGEAICFSVSLDPHSRVSIRLRLEPEIDGERRSPDSPPSRRREAALGATREAIRDELPRLVCPNHDVAAAWETALADIAALPLGIDEGPAALAAGIPLYQHFFGRDTLTVGWQAALATTTPLRDALRANAAFQGTRIDAWRDEEPGKMLHQLREGPLSRLNADPLRQYYGGSRAWACGASASGIPCSTSIAGFAATAPPASRSTAGAGGFASCASRRRRRPSRGQRAPGPSCAVCRDDRPRIAS